jgi:hypothetical protein
VTRKIRATRTWKKPGKFSAIMAALNLPNKRIDEAVPANLTSGLRR